MILRKRRITIFIIVSIIILFLILTILGILLLRTDIFKSNQDLFLKYFAQNVKILDIFKDQDFLEINNMLDNNKYTAESNIEVNYTQNKGTSVENKNSPINKVGLKVESNIDNTSNYSYRNVEIKNEDDNLMKFEYVKQEQNLGIKLDGIQQFVSMDIYRDKDILKELKLENIEGILSKIDINSIFTFTEEEKKNLANAYINIIQEKTDKDRSYKQLNSLITVNGKDIQTNAYYIKLTIEEYNNIIIEILTKAIQDEIILSRIDLVEIEIKAKYAEYNMDESLRDRFINIVKEKIKEIQDNNIGNEEVKITVYENNKNTIRTLIEKSLDKTTIDIYEDSLIEINKVELGDITKEEFIKIQKQKDEVNRNISLEYALVENKEIINDLKCDYQQEIKDEIINNKIDIEVSNQKNICVINVANSIKFVQEFSDRIVLDENNIVLNDLEEERLKLVLEILSDNMKEQLATLNSVVKLEDYINMFRNLGFIDNISSIEMPTQGQVSQTEKKRFNAQFEFFVSNNLTTNNIKELINVSQNNFEDMKVLLETGEIEDLDIDKLNSLEENMEYIKSISEILVFVKSNTYNNEKKEDTINFIENNTANKYNVFLQYDVNGLVRLIRIQIQK